MLLTDGPVLCPFRLLTGHPCPGCGLTRSILALGGGDLHAALAYHPFGPLLALVAIGAGMTWVLRRSGRPLKAPPPWLAAFGRLAGATVALAWLAWAPTRW